MQNAELSTAKSPVSARVRHRSIDVTAPAETVTPVLPPAIANSVAEFVRLNNISNEAKRAADKAKREVENALRAAGLTGTLFDVDTVSGVYEAGVVQSEANEISIPVLAKHVDMTTFVKIVSATQKDVLDAAGATVLAKCLVTVTKGEAIKITKKKAVN